jgi:hypothetical protein
MQYLHDAVGQKIWIRLLPELFFVACVLVFTAVRLIEARAAFVRAPGADWNSSEWMINYATGFVRRGLGGELVLSMMHVTGLSFFAIWATTTTAIYLAVCGYVALRSYRRGGPGLWRFCLLMNPALLIFPLECRPYGSFLRKEVLFVAGTALLVSLCERALKRGRMRSVTDIFPVLASFVVLSVTLALLHEGMFLFGWLPLNAAVLLTCMKRRQVGLKAAWILVGVAALPALAATAASVHWHGDAQTASAICESWHAESIPTVCVAGSQFPPAVDALSWSVRDAVRITMKGAPRAPIFLAILVFVAALLLASIGKIAPEARLDHRLAVLVFPLLFALPIFVLGWDWGRYLFMAMGQQLCVMLSGTLRGSVFDVLPGSLRDGITRLSDAGVRKPLEAFAQVVERVPLLVCAMLLVLPVPGVPPERTMFKGSPPVILVDFARKFPTGADPY